MLEKSQCPLQEETLVTLDEAAKDFGGIPISIATLRMYVYETAFPE